MRLVGLALLAIAVISLVILIGDWFAAVQCRRDFEHLLALCSGPLPSYLYAVCAVLGLIGAYLVFRPRRA